jgi:hypothetical protein
MRASRRVHKKAWKAIWVFAGAALLLSALPLSPAIAQDGETEEGKIIREKRYYYQAFNRRDPFQSLIVGEYEQSEFELVDINAVTLVGVLSGGMEKYAMLEDGNGFAYILKAGDPVRNGSVVSVGDRTLVARITMFGQTTSVTLNIEGSSKSKGES